MRIVTFAGQKGGIGKSTSAIALSMILKKRGRKVLVVDADPQRNTSTTLGADINNHPTLYDALFDETKYSICDVIQHTEFCDVIAGDHRLFRVDLNLEFENYPQKEISQLVFRKNKFFLLSSKLRTLTAYDYIIVDTNPHLDMWLDECIVASDEILMPFNANGWAASGIQELIDTIMNVKMTVNPNVNISGAFFTLFKDNTNLAKDIYEQMVFSDTGFKIHFFKQAIRISNKMIEGQTEGVPFVGRYYEKATSMEDYEKLVTELLELWGDK